MRAWLPFLLLIVLARPAAAGLDASWNGCFPIVTDRVLPSGATTSPLYFSVTGLSGTVKGFQFQFSYGSRYAGPKCGAYSVPDAWRFETNGCQGFLQVKLTSRDAACPQLAGANPLELVKVTYDPFDAHATIVCALGWQTPVTVDPSTRYHLADILFDHTYAVEGPGTPNETCGGFEAPMCFTLQGHQYDAHGDCAPSDGGLYLDANGVQHSFGPYPDVIATFRTHAANLACDGATPSVPMTWGALRAQYR